LYGLQGVRFTQKRTSKIRKTLKKIREKVIEILPSGISIDAVDIWFQDEAKVGQRGTATRTWAVKGTPPD